MINYSLSEKFRKELKESKYFTISSSTLFSLSLSLSPKTFYKY